MRIKSRKFMAKNNATISPEKLPEPESNTTTSECLICHEFRIEGLVVPFRRITQQTLQEETYQSFGSCYHTFHVECLAQTDSNICPLCKAPFTLIVHELYR